MTLKAKLMSITLGILLFFGLASFTMFKKSVDHQRDQILDNFGNFSTTLSNSIMAQFYERYGDVQAFANNEALMSNNYERSQFALNAYTRLYGIYDVILVVDLNGKYVVSNTISPEGKPINVNSLKSKDYSKEPWFVNAVAGKFTESSDKSLNSTYVEDPHFDPIVSAVAGSAKWGNSFSTIIKDHNDKPVAVITNRANFRWAEEEFKNLYANLKTQSFGTAELTMLNKDGTVIVDYDPTENNQQLDVKHDEAVLGKLNLAQKNVFAATQLVAGKSGSTIATHARKKIDQVSGYTKIVGDKFVNSLGWGVMVRVAKSEVYASMDAAEYQFFFVVSIICALCVASILWFTGSLSKTLSKISDRLAEGGKNVLAGSTQLTGASQTVSSGAVESASALEETVSSVEELSTMVRQNAENAKQAADLSQVSTESAETGESEIKKLTEAMSAISESSKKIEEIINVIDDIAFQTNLLALNAAVEAARAGEQGKGFAVVAEAVRNLAQRSSAAAKDITGLIKDSVHRIENGSKIANNSGNVLKEIVSNVKKVGSINNEIASASAEQASGISQISKAMSELDSSTQQNASASEEMAASADQMSYQAKNLEEIVLELSAIVHGAKKHETPRATTENVEAVSRDNHKKAS